jgi:hypothetical protein
VRRFFRIKGLAKGSKAVKLFWLFTALAVICGGLAIASHYLAYELFGWTSTVYRERRELSPNRHISISSADMPLEVFTHDGDKIIVEYTGETELLIYEDELELRISRVEDFALSLFSRDKFNYVMRVWLPAGYYAQYEDIRLTSASGNIHAGGIRAVTLTATSRSGNVRLSAIEAELEINTRSGDVDIEFDSFTAEARVNAGTGDVRVFMPDGHNVRLDFITDSGGFTSDFFDYDILPTAPPISFTVFTDTGNLEFNRK